jgi:hypothetical protein
VGRVPRLLYGSLSCCGGKWFVLYLCPGLLLAHYFDHRNNADEPNIPSHQVTAVFHTVTLKSIQNEISQDMFLCILKKHSTNSRVLSRDWVSTDINGLQGSTWTPHVETVGEDKVLSITYI